MNTRLSFVAAIFAGGTTVVSGATLYQFTRPDLSVVVLGAAAVLSMLTGAYAMSTKTSVDLALRWSRLRERVDTRSRVRTTTKIDLDVRVSRIRREVPSELGALADQVVDAFRDGANDKERDTREWCQSFDRDLAAVRWRARFRRLLSAVGMRRVRSG